MCASFALTPALSQGERKRLIQSYQAIQNLLCQKAEFAGLPTSSFIGKIDEL